ncbi:MAG TPA: glycerol-3-phosphate dehydrogenase/oxidase [Dehalococcoidia bacterium]|nr:glycerol-3-phosphate dehydrogenase/oxidase [Dehalococcoidia bacterium]
MKRDFDKLRGENFDLIVVGGGIVGAGIAHDAALRGLNTLLVEKAGFAHGTTSRSTRLIHGGLRYLRTMQFGLVRQDLREREIILKIAPHLVHRLQFIIPALRSEPFYRFSLPFGLYLYDFLAKGKGIPRWRRLSRQKTLEVEPGLADINGLVGSYLYYDCQAEFMERLCLENLLSAAENGACILNHAAAINLLAKDDVVHGIEVKDTLTGENYIANGRMVVNAGGHWADLMWEKLNIQSKDRLRRTKGIHLLTKKVSNNALVLFAKSDGRLFFITPLREHSLIGTTDTDYTADLDTIHASASDVEYLVTEMRHYFPQFGADDIYYAMAGLRSLVASGDKTASDTSRAHKLVDHELKNGIKGYITVLGGKITAYRAIAEEVLDLVCKKFSVQAPCTTADTPLPGAPAVPAQDIEQAAQQHDLPLETVAYLATLYGSRFSSVLGYVSADKRLGQPVAASCIDILAQINYAVEEEEALTLSDFMLCCTNIGLGPSQGLDAVETVAREMGLLLGWSKTEEQDQIENYRALAALGQRFRTEAVNS